MSNLIHNPILPGFNPDPSIIRVNDDYYIATSTFEWFPGVQIHHSKDLIHWELIASPLNRLTQLDLRGVDASRGVWAPCLSYDKGIFYLCYTVVKSFQCNMYDTHNYLVVTDDIFGDWSDPIYLNSYGFDPSLFHDDDGKKYIVFHTTDHRRPKLYKGYIMLQEYSLTQMKLIGEPKPVFLSKSIFVEGPHLYKRNGYYYLFVADSGTGEEHGQSLLKSKELYGEYEWYEQNPVITAREYPDNPLQKTGHCDLVETQNGDWYMTHLCGRPLNKTNPPHAASLPGARRYCLGRETAIQKVEWTDDGWLRLTNGTKLADLDVIAPDLQPHPFPSRAIKDDFNDSKLNIHFQTLRIPFTEDIGSLTARKGYLRLYGREGLSSKFIQSLVARRWQSFQFEASACMEFEPAFFKQMAGLICMYDQDNYYYLHVTHHEHFGKCICILTSVNRQYDEPVGYIPIDVDRVYLKVKVCYEKLQFYYTTSENMTYQPVGPVLDASNLSDEACKEGNFTGAMVGVCCQDLTGGRKYADFDWFQYQE